MWKTMLPAIKSAGSAMGRRIGTAFAAWLLAQGLPEQHIEQVLIGLTALAGVALDLGLAYAEKRTIATKAFVQGLQQGSAQN
ncbi:hypothetical protein [Flyfo microvirus Tbat2_112]|nr:hypothetical protein [Flyfo microvirus Tbat2_112]